MGTTVQARLDSETQATLSRVAKRLGWSTSKVVREGIHLLDKSVEPSHPIQIIGLGEFDSGITDLASNKKHLAGFGRSSMPGGKTRRKAMGH
jgi:hypothetical protein